MTKFQPFAQFSPKQNDKPIVVVGAGLAGLFVALKLSEQGSWPIVVISPAKLGESNASAWAQAGIAASVGEEDSPQLHSWDTIAAGAGLNDAEVVSAICEAAAEHIAQLDSYGVPFDRIPTVPEQQVHERPEKECSLPLYVLSYEAAHSTKRIVRCTGDSSGRLIIKSLIAVTQPNPQIQVIEGALAHRLLQTGKGLIYGIEYHFLAEVDNSGTAPSHQIEAAAVLLACGGIGALYAATTNPSSALGQGLGMAARAGAVLADCEFVQFHPTALDLAEDPKPLASEALRGEGALLLDAVHKRFMLEELERGAELAPRNIVAQGVFRARRETGAAYLDCRNLCPNSKAFAECFPTLWENAQRHQLDPCQDLLPVIPAAHYHMGGIATDLRGRSSVTGLWAIGEVACTGLHGANRLASNSLLEAVVMASNAAADILEQLGRATTVPPHDFGPAQKIPQSTLETKAYFSQDWRCLMSGQIGVERSSIGLCLAVQKIAAELDTISQAKESNHRYQQENIFMAALAISTGALLRTESRGSHFFLPNPDATSSPLLSKGLEELLQKHSNNGQRSFLNWQNIEQIAAAVLKYG